MAGGHGCTYVTNEFRINRNRLGDGWPPTGTVGDLQVSRDVGSEQSCRLIHSVDAVCCKGRKIFKRGRVVHFCLLIIELSSVALAKQSADC